LKLVVMKKGGQPGSIAINPARVTHVRSSAGPFTDVFFGEHFVSVEGSFSQVVASLEGDEDVAQKPPVANWLKMP
jgi:hypothetical protein